ncbi:MAG: ZrgA family zinc uptake protein [Oceanicaulis sp.]
MRLFVIASASTLAFAAPAIAQSEDGAMRQLGAHVHGAAELIAALDPDGTLVAELSGAQWNFYGFEGTAETEDQIARLGRTAATVEAPGLLSFGAAAGCVLTETAIAGAPEAAAFVHDTADHDDHDHEHERDHDHGRHHEEAHDDNHAHDHHDHGGDGHVHGNLIVNWTFACENPDRIDAIDASGLFAAFERLERVEVQYLDTDGAAAGDVTPEAPALDV